MSQKILDTVQDIGDISKFNHIVSKYKEYLLIFTFYTDTCPTCKGFAPGFIATQAQFKKDKVVFGRINANKVPEISRKYGIMAVPDTIFIKNKKLLIRKTGGYPKSQFSSIVTDVLKQYFNYKGEKFSEFDAMYM